MAVGPLDINSRQSQIAEICHRVDDATAFSTIDCLVYLKRFLLPNTIGFCRNRIHVQSNSCVFLLNKNYSSRKLFFSTADLGPQKTTHRTSCLLTLQAFLSDTKKVMSFFFSRLFRPLSTSSSLGFSATEPLSARNITMPDNAQKATVAAGCFWGVEHLYRKHFGNGKGLLDAKVGYAGGHTDSPSYRSVCSGSTGRMF